MIEQVPRQNSKRQASPVPQPDLKYSSQAKKHFEKEDWQVLEDNLKQKVK